MRPLTISELRELCVKFIPDEDVSTESLRLANGSFGKIAAIKQSGGDQIFEDLMETLQNPRATAADFMMIAKKIAGDAALHGILLDAAAALGLAGLYPTITMALSDISRLYLEPELAIFKILLEIKECL